MKSRFLFVVLSFFIFSLAFSQQRYERVRQYPLNNNDTKKFAKKSGVQSLKVFNYNCKDGKAEEKGFTEVEMSFDKKGNIIRWKRFDRSGKMTDDVKYNYDYKGNLEAAHVVANDTSLLLLSNEYYPKGSIQKQSIYNLDGTVAISFFDAQGNITEKGDYNVDGTIIKKLTYKTDPKSGAILDGSDKNTKAKETYKYNPKTGLLQSLLLIDENQNKTTINYEYNATGDCIGETHIDKAKKVIKTVKSKFDNMGNVTENEVNDIAANKYFKITAKYDEASLIVEEISYDKTGVQLEIRKVVYEFY
ncbi:MAG: hypothetical protein V2A54_04155 [Bacteroidota bacterium]